MKTSALGIAVVANVVLATGLALLWSDPDRYRWTEPAPIKPTFGDLAARPASQLADATLYQETLQRPLFSPNRRPAAVVSSSGEDAPRIDPFKDVRLFGLYGTANRGGAILTVSGKLERVPFGGKIGEWTLEGQEGRDAVLVDGRGERRRLALALVTDAPAAASKAAGAASSQAPVSRAARASSGAASRDSRDARAGTRARLSDEERNRRLLEATARINAARAKRGLPPIKEQ